MTGPELHTLAVVKVSRPGYAATWDCSCGAHGQRTTGYPVPPDKLLALARAGQASHRRTAQRNAARS